MSIQIMLIFYLILCKLFLIWILAMITLLNYLSILKLKLKKQIKKLLKLVSAILIEKSGYIEEYDIDKNINYCEYIDKHIKK